MCFSASASFIASSLLLAGGVIAVKNTKTNHQLPFAFIPLIFSLQQFCEGILWLSFTHPEYAKWQSTATFAFLIFAQVVWAAWVPFSVVLVEKNEQRKKLLKAILTMGLMVSCYLAYCIFNFPISASAEAYHISYHLDFPHKNLGIIGLFYVIPTVFSALVSGQKNMKVIGVANLVSFLVTKYFFGEYVISVWCFFAAIISFAVFLIVKDMNKSVFL
jgi:hypothetical protein